MQQVNLIINWIRANYKFVLLIVLLLMLALMSLGYAFSNVSKNNNPTIAATNVDEPTLERLPLAEEISESSDNSTSSNDSQVTLGSNTKCLSNQKAMAAVNLKIQQEKARNNSKIQEIGIGKVISQQQKQKQTKEENARHTGAMAALSQEYNYLLSQIDC